MEMNKGEAEKCLEIAKRALRTGQFDKAVRFFDKSQRLYPLPGVEGMRERAKNELAKEQESAASSSSASEDASNLRRRASAPAEPAAASYTEEQRNIVRKIQSCRTHYEVLSVATTAEDKEIKKAYRKLALKLHPDKNRAPGAEDAFKAVGRAFAVLSDPDKRSDYDRFGDAGPAGAASSRRPQRQHYRQAYGEDVSPEEIFNMFFGGGFHPAQRRPRPRPTQRRREPPHQAQAQQMSFTQLLPLLLMVLLALLSLPSGPNEPFSMKPTQQYNVERSTSVGSVTKNIPYYVDRDFDRTYTAHWRDLQRVEIQVEQQYMSQLAESCESQKRKQKRAIHKARHARSDQRESAMKAAMDMKAPACDHLRSLRQNRRKHK